MAVHFLGQSSNARVFLLRVFFSLLFFLMKHFVLFLLFYSVCLLFYLGHCIEYRLTASLTSCYVKLALCMEFLAKKIYFDSMKTRHIKFAGVSFCTKEIELNSINWNISIIIIHFVIKRMKALGVVPSIQLSSIFSYNFLVITYYYRAIKLDWQKVLSFYSQTINSFSTNEVFPWSICIDVLFYVKFALRKSIHNLQNKLD